MLHWYRYANAAATVTAATAAADRYCGYDDWCVGADFRDIELLSNMNTANASRYAGMPPDTDASIQALAAGVDQDLGGYSYGSLIPATQANLVPKDVAGQHGIDEACSNVLRSKFAAGLFDQPYTDPVLLEQIDSRAHRALAKDAVIDGATLLQNLGGVLPTQISRLKKVVSFVASPHPSMSSWWSHSIGPGLQVLL